MDLGHVGHMGSGPAVAPRPGWPSLLGDDRCLQVQRAPGYNMDSRIKDPFSYENKRKKKVLLTTTNEITVHLESTKMPLI